MATKKKTNSKPKKSLEKVQKKTVSKKVHKPKVSKKTQDRKKKVLPKNVPTLKLLTDQEIATDFGVKAYKFFDKIIKSVILFGSVEKKKISHNSDIDIILLIDDVSLKWDMELTSWYREELEKLIQANPYTAELHINTVKLSTWWDGLLKGDPVVLNAIRNGHVIIDHAGFVEPLKFLMARGKISGTPEAIYQCLQRAPNHLARSKAAELTSVEGIYWSMVDSAHGALIAAGFFPPSPEHVSKYLTDAFVSKGMLKSKYVNWYKDLYELYKKIDHGEIKSLKGLEVDQWQERAQEFMEVMILLVKKVLED